MEVILKILRGKYILINVQEYPKELLELMCKHIDGFSPYMSDGMSMGIRISNNTQQGSNSLREYIEDRERGYFQEYPLIDLRDLPSKLPKYIKPPKGY